MSAIDKLRSCAGLTDDMALDIAQFVDERFVELQRREFVTASQEPDPRDARIAGLERTCALATRIYGDATKEQDEKIELLEKQLAAADEMAKAVQRCWGDPDSDDDVYAIEAYEALRRTT